MKLKNLNCDETYELKEEQDTAELGTNIVLKQTNNYVSRDRKYLTLLYLVKMARIIWFDSTCVDIGSAYVNKWKR